MIVPEGMKIVLPGKGKALRVGDEIPVDVYNEHIEPNKKKIDEWKAKRKKFKEKTLKNIMEQGLTKKKVSTPEEPVEDKTK